MVNEKSKPRFSLKKYLVSKGVVFSADNLCHCFSPSHKDNNPSCQITENQFYCHSCGIKGDIYDAVGILEGIPKVKDQYFFLENLKEADNA
jgi:hypothetical protein